jgi:hypothetical protein
VHTDSTVLSTCAPRSVLLPKLRFRFSTNGLRSRSARLLSHGVLWVRQVNSRRPFASSSCLLRRVSLAGSPASGAGRLASASTLVPELLALSPPAAAVVRLPEGVAQVFVDPSEGFVPGGYVGQPLLGDLAVVPQIPDGAVEMRLSNSCCRPGRWR